MNYFEYRDLNRDWLETTYSTEIIANLATIEVFGINISSILLSFGTVGMRILGLITNVLNIHDWAIIGYGTGAVQRWDIHKSGFINYHDPGWAQQFMFENGFLSSLCFALACLIYAKKIFDNGKYNCNLFGICAVVIFALSARDMWIVVLPLIMLLKLHHNPTQVYSPEALADFVRRTSKLSIYQTPWHGFSLFAWQSFQNRAN